MRQPRVEFEARYYFPDREDSRMWRWYREREILYPYIPSGPGESFVTHLPPPMFTFSAVDVARLEFVTNPAGHIEFRMSLNAYQVIRWTPWRETALWQQVRFASAVDGINNRQWTLRWRCPDAPNDIWAKTYAYLETRDDPEAQQLRREITLCMLGATDPRCARCFGESAQSCTDPECHEQHLPTEPETVATEGIRDSPV